MLVEADGGRQSEIVQSAGLTYARLSPDAQFVLLGRKAAAGHQFVMKRVGSAPASSDEWPVAEGGLDDVAAGWSPDGTLVYFLLHRDGHRCLWAQRLEHRSKRPVGTPFAVLHFHKSTAGWIRLSTGRVIAGGRFVYSQTDSPSNIWMTEIH